MSVIDDYLDKLSGADKQTIAHMYRFVRQMVPDATEEFSYAMPAFKYKGKSLVAIVANKNFLSLYPFGAVSRLGIDLSKFETTSGSIHFSPDQPIPDNMLQEIISVRKRQIEK